MKVLCLVLHILWVFPLVLLLYYFLNTYYFWFLLLLWAHRCQTLRWKPFYCSINSHATMANLCPHWCFLLTLYGAQRGFSLTTNLESGPTSVGLKLIKKKEKAMWPFFRKTDFVSKRKANQKGETNAHLVTTGAAPQLYVQQKHKATLIQPLSEKPWVTFMHDALEPRHVLRGILWL